MDNNLKITVAIPTFDREKYLGQVLESLSGQTEKSFKVILFDNASPYDIQALMLKFPNLRIALERNSVNMGNQANFERVMAYQFDTPYVMIFHDDDAIHLRYFEDALSIFEKNPSLNWIGSYIHYTKDNDKMLFFKEIPMTSNTLFLNKQELTDAFMNNSPIGFSSVIYKREVLSRTDPDAKRFHKWLDRPFMLEACGADRIAVFTFPYINYRIHSSQDSAQAYKERLPEMINLIEYFTKTATPGMKNKVFSTASAIRTAAVNASSVSDFFSILKQFGDRGLYSPLYLRPYAVAWLLWLLWKRVRPYLLIK